MWQSPSTDQRLGVFSVYSPVWLSLEYGFRVTRKQGHYFVVTNITAVMLIHMGHYCMILVTRSTRLNVKAWALGSAHWARLVQQFDGQEIEQCKFRNVSEIVKVQESPSVKITITFLLGRHRWSHREPIIGGVLNNLALLYLQQAQVVSWLVHL